MQYGDLWKLPVDEWELSLTLDAETDATATGRRNFVPGGAAQAGIFTQYDTFLGIRTGIAMSIATTRNGTPTTDVTLSCPSLAISQSISTAGFSPTKSLTFSILTPRPYAKSDGTYLFTSTGVTWKVDGATEYTGGAFSKTGPDLAQAYLPLIGIAPELSANADPGWTADDAIDWDTLFYSWAIDEETGEPTKVYSGGLAYLPYDVQASATATATGGFRFRIGSTWYDLPSELPPDGGYHGGLSVSRTYGASVTRTRSQHVWRDVVTPMSYRECGDHNYEWYYAVREFQDNVETGASRVVLFPTLDSEVVRMEADTALLYYRAGMPRTRALVTSKPFTELLDDDTSTSVVVHPRRSEYLGRMGDDGDAGEDALEIPGYAWYGANASHAYEELADPGPDSLLSHCGVFQLLNNEPWTCPVDGYGGSPCSGLDFDFPKNGYETALFPVDVDTRGENPDILFGLSGGGNPYCIYTNTLTSPLWNYFEYFGNWEVDGVPAGPQSYWGRLREQWHYNDALPEASATRRRNSIVSSPCTRGWIGWYVDNCPFLGVSRFQVLTPEIPASKATDGTSDPAFTTSTSGAALAIDGSGITVTPNGASPVVVDLDLGRFDVPPYEYALLAKQIDLAWDDCDCTVSLVSADSDSVPLPGGEGTITLPRKATSTYAGSWGDFGVGEVLDVGADTLPAGKTALMLGDSERIASVQLPRVGNGAILRFTVVPDAPDATCLIHHPVFRKSTDAPTLIHETGSVSTWLWPNAPAYRFGTRSWYDAVADTPLNPPVAAAPGYKSTVWDALMESKVVLAGEAPATGTLVSDRYDAVEIGTDSDEKAAAIYTTSFALPGSVPRLALVNVLAEIPPLAMFPRGIRGSDWEETGDFALKTYILAKEPRYLITAGATAGLFTSGGTEWTVPSGITVPGWGIKKHNHEVDNTETDFEIRLQGVSYGIVRPWHGFLWAPLGTTQTRVPSQVFHRHDQLGPHMLASVADDEVWFRRATSSVPEGGWESEVQVTTSADCRSPRFALSRWSERIELYYERADSGGAPAGLFQRFSYDDGDSFTNEEELVPGNAVLLAGHEGELEGDHMLVYMVPDADDGTGPGVFRTRYRSAGEETFSSAVTAVDDTSTEIRIEAGGLSNPFQSFNGCAYWTVWLTREGETEPSLWLSDDGGVSWKRYAGT